MSSRQAFRPEAASWPWLPWNGIVIVRSISHPRSTGGKMQEAGGRRQCSAPAKIDNNTHRLPCGAVIGSAAECDRQAPVALVGRSKRRSTGRASLANQRVSALKDCRYCGGPCHVIHYVREEPCIYGVRINTGKGEVLVYRLFYGG
jgi:hypothetical protein